MNCLSAAEQLNRTEAADSARPLPARTETPKTRADVAKKAAERRFIRTCPIIDQAENVHLSLVRGFTPPVHRGGEPPQGSTPVRCLLFQRGRPSAVVGLLGTAGTAADAPPFLRGPSRGFDRADRGTRPLPSRSTIDG